MTTTAEKIAVMQAFERGESIEYATTGKSDWMTIACPNWDWRMWDYRVYPKPLEFLFVVDKNGSATMEVDNYTVAYERCRIWDKLYPNFAPHRVARMREVTP